jgi:hypothetical protein
MPLALKRSVNRLVLNVTDRAVGCPAGSKFGGQENLIHLFGPRPDLGIRLGFGRKATVAGQQEYNQ